MVCLAAQTNTFWDYRWDKWMFAPLPFVSSLLIFTCSHPHKELSEAEYIQTHKMSLLHSASCQELQRFMMKQKNLQPRGSLGPNLRNVVGTLKINKKAVLDWDINAAAIILTTLSVSMSECFLLIGSELSSVPVTHRLWNVNDSIVTWIRNVLRGELLEPSKCDHLWLQAADR